MGAGDWHRPSVRLKRKEAVLKFYINALSKMIYSSALGQVLNIVFRSVIIALMCLGFSGVLLLIAHGFKWLG